MNAFGRWNRHRILAAAAPPLVWDFAGQRHVRTPAGVRRYGLPIGSPIPIGRRNRARIRPNPNQQGLGIEQAMSDDDLDTQMAAALERDDLDSFERFAKETDRREAEAERRERRRTTDRARREEARRVRDEERATAYEAALDAGMDDEQAMEEIYGMPLERQRRQRAMATLNSSGYKGSFDQVLRQSFRDHVFEQYMQAEDDTRGHMLNTRAEQINARAAVRPGSRKVDTLSLFTGPEHVARAHASEELLAWWDVNGRPTLEEWTAELLGDNFTARNARSGRSDFHR